MLCTKHGGRYQAWDEEDPTPRHSPLKGALKSLRQTARQTATDGDAILTDQTPLDRQRRSVQDVGRHGSRGGCRSRAFDTCAVSTTRLVVAATTRMRNHQRAVLSIWSTILSTLPASLILCRHLVEAPIRSRSAVLLTAPRAPHRQ